MLTVLFSGHMIDRPGRTSARLPAHATGAAAQRIATALDELGLARGDRALSSGACGGDLLFAEAALARGARLEIFLPQSRSEFAATSVDYAGRAWRERYERVLAHPATRVRIAPDELGPLPAGDDAYERANRWMLAASLEGATPPACLCLWDGGEGDGPGGTRDMVARVLQAGGTVRRIDPATL
jgi:hypothetical protein